MKLNKHDALFAAVLGVVTGLVIVFRDHIIEFLVRLL